MRVHHPESLSLSLSRLFVCFSPSNTLSSDVLGRLGGRFSLLFSKISSSCLCALGQQREAMSKSAHTPKWNHCQQMHSLNLITRRERTPAQMKLLDFSLCLSLFSVLSFVVQYASALKVPKPANWHQVYPIQEGAMLVPQ